MCNLHSTENGVNPFSAARLHKFDWIVICEGSDFADAFPCFNLNVFFNSFLPQAVTLIVVGYKLLIYPIWRETKHLMSKKRSVN